MIHLSQDKKNKLVNEEIVIPIGIDLSDFHQNHEWDILSVPAKRTVLKNRDYDEFYPEITFNISLRRKTLFYTCNLIIPCVCLTFLTVLTFYLPSESGEKISLCISILLSLTVFILLPNDLIPPTSLVVPLIGKYLIFIIIIVTLSITCTIFVLNLHFRSINTQVIPMWAQRLFLNVLPKILLMKPTIMITPEFSTSILKENMASYYFENDNFIKSLEFKNTKFKDLAMFNLYDKVAFKTIKQRNAKLKNLEITLNNSISSIRNKKDALLFIKSLKENISRKLLQKKVNFLNFISY